MHAFLGVSLDRLAVFHEDVPTQIAVAGLVLNALAVDLVLEASLRFLVGEPERFDTAVVIGALLLGFASVAGYLPRLRRRPVAMIAVFIVLLWLAAIALYDTSWDSESYHFPAVIALAHGWNPVAAESSMPKADIWPNGIWTLQAQLYRLLGFPEGGKAVTALLALVALLLSASALRELRGRRFSRLDVAALLVLVANPVAMSQLLTFYLDGAVYYLSLSLFAALLLVATEHRRLALVVVAGALVLLVNTKLAGLYYAATVGLAGWLLAPMRTGDRLKSALAGIAAAIVAIGFVGWRPYITNIVSTGTPIVIGPGSLQRPPNLEAMPPPVQLVVSLLSATDGANLAPAHLKLPFVVTPREVWYMATPDPRIAGCGPLFAPVLVAALAGTFLLRRHVIASRPARICALAALAGLAISAGFPEAWLARYVPLVWAAPPFLLLSWPADAPRWAVRLGAAIVILALANSVLALSGNLARLAYFDRDYGRMLASIRQSDDKIIFVPSGYVQFHVAFAERFRRAGIETRIGGPDDCVRLIRSYRGMLICRGP
jgi:hypothetical protein